MNLSSSPLCKIVLTGLVMGCVFVMSSGCSSPAKTAQTETTTRMPVLVKGMKAEEVLRLVGKPVRIRKMESELPAEVWEYNRQLPSVTSLSGATTQSVPTANPLTGAPGTMADINYRPETIEREQHSELLMVNGELVSSKQYVTEKHSFN